MKQHMSKRNVVQPPCTISKKLHISGKSIVVSTQVGGRKVSNTVHCYSLDVTSNSNVASAQANGCSSPGSCTLASISCIRWPMSLINPSKNGPNRFTIVSLCCGAKLPRTFAETGLEDAPDEDIFGKDGDGRDNKRKMAASLSQTVVWPFVGCDSSHQCRARTSPRFVLPLWSLPWTWE
jgi:hypothetical protein